MRMYIDDNPGGLLATSDKMSWTAKEADTTWMGAIYANVGDAKIYNCGSATGGKYEGKTPTDGKTSVGMNATNSGKADTLFVSPSSTAIFADVPCDTTNSFSMLAGAPGAASLSAITYARQSATTNFKETSSTLPLMARHSDSVNVTLYDGHVQTYKYQNIPAAAAGSAFWAYNGTGE